MDVLRRMEFLLREGWCVDFSGLGKHWTDLAVGKPFPCYQRGRAHRGAVALFMN